MLGFDVVLGCGVVLEFGVVFGFGAILGFGFGISADFLSVPFCGGAIDIGDLPWPRDCFESGFGGGGVTFASAMEANILKGHIGSPSSSSSCRLLFDPENSSPHDDDGGGACVS